MSRFLKLGCFETKFGFFFSDFLWQIIWLLSKKLVVNFKLLWHEVDLYKSENRDIYKITDIN